MYVIPNLHDQQTYSNLFLAPIIIRSRSRYTRQHFNMCADFASHPELSASRQKFQKLQQKSYTIILTRQPRRFSLDNIVVQWSFVTTFRNFKIQIYFSSIGRASPLSLRKRAFSPSQPLEKIRRDNVDLFEAHPLFYNATWCHKSHVTA